MSPWVYSQTSKQMDSFLLIKKIFLAMACGILVLRSRIEPGPLHWEYGVLTTEPWRKFPKWILKACNGFLTHSALATLAVLLFLAHAMHTPAVGTLWDFFPLLGQLYLDLPVVGQRAKGDGRRVWLEWRSHAKQNSMDNQSHWEFCGQNNVVSKALF